MIVFVGGFLGNLNEQKHKAWTLLYVLTTYLSHCHPDTISSVLESDHKFLKKHPLPIPLKISCDYIISDIRRVLQDIFTPLQATTDYYRVACFVQIYRSECIYVYET